MVNKQFAMGLHIMTALACGSEELVSSEYLANSLSTNPVVVRRILSKLSKAGLIETARGKNGGVRLKKTAHKITLADIYSALTETTLINPNDKRPQKSCAVSCGMGNVMKKVIDGVEDATIKFLSAQKLSDCAQTIK